MLNALITGFGFALGLIAAIGAQNAYVLRQAMLGRQIWATAFTASGCDIVLIALGVLGSGAALAAVPALGWALKWMGVAFLLWFAGQSAVNALRARPSGWSEAESGLLAASTSARGAIGATLAISLLNPHVYLDTVVLIGSQSARFAGSEKLAFTLGAMLASSCWFTTLAVAGKQIRPWLRTRLAQRLLEGAIALLMLFFALLLAQSDLSAPISS